MKFYMWSNREFIPVYLSTCGPDLMVYLSRFDDRDMFTIRSATFTFAAIHENYFTVHGFKNMRKKCGLEEVSIEFHMRDCSEIKEKENSNGQ